MVKKRKPKKASVRRLLPRPYNMATLTEAGFKAFIISALRKASMYWKPKNECLRRARVSKWMYLCAWCERIVPGTLPPLPWKKKRTRNILADHIDPIVNPVVGFEGYDVWIARCFIEVEWFQALCKECHDIKTLWEKRQASERPSINNSNNNNNS